MRPDLKSVLLRCNMVLASVSEMPYIENAASSESLRLFSKVGSPIELNLLSLPLCPSRTGFDKSYLIKERFGSVNNS